MENKFQAWDTVLNCMVEPSAYLIGFDGRIYFNLDGDLIDQTFKLKLRRYTGLKDKNGKEIYEGDIVNSERGFWGGGVVFWDTDAWLLGNPDNTSQADHLSTFPGLEVIGNIYENPDLLTPTN